MEDTMTVQVQMTSCVSLFPFDVSRLLIDNILQTGF